MPDRSATTDPSRNVYDMIALGVAHQGELRAADTRRQDDLRAAEGRRIDDQMQLRAELGKQLRDAETARIDAIRAVDVGAVAAAAAVQLAQQNTLAATVDRSAEAMRNSQAQAASTVATTLDAKITPLTLAIGDLQRFQFESGGAKAQVVESRDADADMKPVLDAIANLTAAQTMAAGAQRQVTENRERGGSTALWLGLAVSVAAVVSSLLVGVAAIAVTLLLTRP